MINVKIWGFTIVSVLQIIFMKILQNVGVGGLAVKIKTPGFGLATLLTLLTTLKLSPAVKVVAAYRHKYQVPSTLTKHILLKTRTEGCGQ